jgi:hypothetical protein
LEKDRIKIEFLSRFRNWIGDFIILAKLIFLGKYNYLRQTTDEERNKVI